MPETLRGQRNPKAVQIGPPKPCGPGSLTHGMMSVNTYHANCRFCGEDVYANTPSVKTCKKPECKKKARDMHHQKAAAKQKWAKERPT